MAFSLTRFEKVLPGILLVLYCHSSYRGGIRDYRGTDVRKLHSRGYTISMEKKEGLVKLIKKKKRSIRCEQG
jgi:hypothetical protein